MFENEELISERGLNYLRDSNFESLSKQNEIKENYTDRYDEMSLSEEFMEDRESNKFNNKDKNNSFLSNIDKRELSEVSSIRSIEMNYDNNHIEDRISFIPIDEDKIETKVKKKKRNKEDLNTTPIPIFECLFCSEEKIVFQHMIRETLSENYLFMASNKDTTKITTILSNSLTFNRSLDFETQHLLNFIIRHTDYITKLYYRNESNTILTEIISGNNSFVPNIKFKFCTFDNTLTLFKTSLGHKIRSNSNDIRFNSRIFVESSPNFSNFYSNSIHFNKNEEELLIKNNIIAMKEFTEDIREEINDDLETSNPQQNESFLKFMKFDLKRKIKATDISFDSHHHDIWNPEFSSEEEKKEREDELAPKVEKQEKDFGIGLTSINHPNERNFPEENFSLQFSSNSIHNLFDTNSNLNIKHNNAADKSLNMNLYNSNINSSYFLPFKTVLSNNSESNQHENLSSILNKSYNSPNTRIRLRGDSSINVNYNNKIFESKNRLNSLNSSVKNNTGNFLSFPITLKKINENKNDKSQNEKKPENNSKIILSNFSNSKISKRYKSFKNQKLIKPDENRFLVYDNLQKNTKVKTSSENLLFNSMSNFNKTNLKIDQSNVDEGINNFQLNHTNNNSNKFKRFSNYLDYKQKYASNIKYSNSPNNKIVAPIVKTTNNNINTTTSHTNSSNLLSQTTKYSSNFISSTSFYSPLNNKEVNHSLTNNKQSDNQSKEKSKELDDLFKKKKRENSLILSRGDIYSIINKNKILNKLSNKLTEVKNYIDGKAVETNYKQRNYYNENSNVKFSQDTKNSNIQNSKLNSSKVNLLEDWKNINSEKNLLSPINNITSFSNSSRKLKKFIKTTQSEFHSKNGQKPQLSYLIHDKKDHSYIKMKSIDQTINNSMSLYNKNKPSNNSIKFKLDMISEYE